MRTVINKGSILLPYVKGLSEDLSRIFKKHRIATIFKPHKTLRSLLVKPKDKRSVHDTAEVIYKVPCKSCEKIYVGETGCKLGFRILEHRKDCEQAEKRDRVTRATLKASSNERNKSAVTDHMKQYNHVIDWDSVGIIDRESHRKSRWIKESIAIKRGGTRAMNRQEGQYELPEIYSAIISPPATPGGESGTI